MGVLLTLHSHGHVVFLTCHSNGCVVVSCFDFNVDVSNGVCCKTSFPVCFLSFLYRSSLVNCLFKTLQIIVFFCLLVDVSHIKDVMWHPKELHLKSQAVVDSHYLELECSSSLIRSFIKKMIVP